MSAQVGGFIRVCLGQVNPDQNNLSRSRIGNTSKDTEHRKKTVEVWENLERQKQTTRMRGAAWAQDKKREQKREKTTVECRSLFTSLPVP